MAEPKEIKGTIALLGVASAAVVAVLLGVLYWSWTGRSDSPQAAMPAQQSPAFQASPGQQAAAKPPVPGETPATKPKDGPVAPSFDLVRVEPDGESVIAGRAAPGATIELLRGDQVHARAAADASGLFAIVPPPLPPGSHLVALQSIAPDGTRQRSAQSVTVVITDAKTRPLVTLTAPDKPTVILSNPEPPAKVAEEPKPEAKTAEAPAAAPQPDQPAPQQQASVAPAAPAPPAAIGQPAPRPEIKIVTVEAEEGKLFVSGQSAPGATVRLYLNESFIAPGGAGGDGKVSFAIGSGVKPGDYRIRLDDVDPVSGQVRSRAEVGFNVPVQVASGQPQAPAPAQPSARTQPSREVASALPDGQIAGIGTVVVPNINTTIVSRGDNLWRISQRIYGKGLRYTVIYGANQEQIRNPNLIYPGQVFVLPGDQGPNSN
ncbi:LysM peptidoglycan-binding domain-containing protein [Microvirga lotononidis]|uniref:LysM domain-containing protein n=1 Tax=Microvirga lotononidis TaxID=864069 RepID=I4Z2J6_9HYPH|nr:LysM peptidoglycan-binding domain-containing protein [Microvirga lotononidis]EIM30438.1 LysM domain-containing protein [Microvirga lotononidis]WQO26281.1 LysM peptidoglycan-binding domain-containing protein [Microvirga lotononidis]